jgi:hypothetical protein
MSGFLLVLSCVVAVEAVVSFEIVADRHFVRAELLSAAGTASFLLLLSCLMVHLPHHSSVIIV